MKAYNPKPQLMFVQSADDVRADEQTHSLRLVNANPQTLYFSDRPVRVAGHILMKDYLQAWNHGKDSFAKDNPNATLSVFEPGRSDNTLVVVEISNPVVDGRDIVYRTSSSTARCRRAAARARSSSTGSLPAPDSAPAASAAREAAWVAGHPGAGVGGPAGVGW